MEKFQQMKELLNIWMQACGIFHPCKAVKVGVNIKDETLKNRKHLFFYRIMICEGYNTRCDSVPKVIGNHICFAILK